MKLIEALKEKKISKKKVDDIWKDIVKYSSITSYEKPSFESVEKQKKHVMSLVQSAIDLLTRRSNLKVMIDKTNINTKIRIPKGIHMTSHDVSLAEALMFKLNYGEYQKIYNSLCTATADLRIRNSGSQNTIPIQLYDEQFKIDLLKDIQTKLEYIDSHLEMLNATTDVVE
jgi:hypothetical protein